VATHVHQPARSLGIPRPFHSAWPFLALAAVGLAVDADRRLPWLVGVGIAAVFLLASGVRLAQAELELRGLRAAADRQILRGVAKPYSEFLAWRAAEVVDPRRRRRVERPLRRLVRDLERRTLPGASPVNRVAGRRHLEGLHEILDRLDDPAPVGARGVLLAHDFLTSPGSPLYAREREAAFPRMLREIRRELDAAD
jgi:hypothetical protein